jgi:hypothetical protein
MVTTPEVQKVRDRPRRAENIAEAAVLFAGGRGTASAGNVLNVGGGVTAACTR